MLQTKKSWVHSNYLGGGSVGTVEERGINLPPPSLQHQQELHAIPQVRLVPEGNLTILGLCMIINLLGLHLICNNSGH